MILTGKKYTVASHSDRGSTVSLHLSSKVGGRKWRKLEMLRISGKSIQYEVFLWKTPRFPFLLNHVSLPERVELCTRMDRRSAPGTLVGWLWTKESTQKKPDKNRRPLTKEIGICVVISILYKISKIYGSVVFLQSVIRLNNKGLTLFF